MIRVRESNRIVGTISLYNINFVKRSAGIALVFGVQPRERNLYGLEAMARTTEHGFEKLGLWRIAIVYKGIVNRSR